MATKHVCDRCEDEIHGYRVEYNSIKFRHFIHEKDNSLNYYGPHSYDKDLCYKCMNELISFLEEPVAVK